MVALKVQSLEGIVTAYVKSLGFQAVNLQKIVQFLMQNHAQKLNHNDVISSLDEILYQQVKKYLPNQREEKTQALAMFKAIFLLHNGAEISGLSLFEKGEIPSQLQQILTENPLKSAPQIKKSKMDAQKIETLDFFALIGKIFHLSRKG